MAFMGCWRPTKKSKSKFHFEDSSFIDVEAISFILFTQLESCFAFKGHVSPNGLANERVEPECKFIHSISWSMVSSSFQKLALICTKSFCQGHKVFWPFRCSPGPWMYCIQELCVVLIQWPNTDLGGTTDSIDHSDFLYSAQKARANVGANRPSIKR